MTKKNRRVIKVPKAQNGLEASGSNWQNNITSQLFANQNNALRNQLSSIANMSQLKADMATGNPLGAFNFNNNTNLNRYNTTNIGGSKGSNITAGVGLLQSIPELIALMSSPFQTSNASTGGEATAQSISDIAGGIGTGASIGSALGPMGALAGAAVGATVGLIGKKGQEAEMTSFTDYDEGSLGTGLIGAFGNRRLRKRRERIKMNALNNRAAVAGTEYLQSEYAEDNSNYNTNTFAEGGSIPSSLAYVDDGELISTPDGTVSKVPEEGKPVDSNLVSLPEGSRVLSNTLKVPGTKKTFAQLGEEMMTKRKSKGKDRFAENANKLNEMNNKQIHDMLFAQQEAIKARKGTKKEYKNLVEEFQIGGEKWALDPYANLGDTPFANTIRQMRNITRRTTANAIQPSRLVYPVGRTHYIQDQDVWKPMQLRQDGSGLFTTGASYQDVQPGDILIYNNRRYRVGDQYTTGNAGNRQYNISYISDLPTPPAVEQPTEISTDYEVAPTAISRARTNRPTRTSVPTSTTATQTTQVAQPTQTAVPTPPQIEQPLDLIEEDYEIRPTYISRYTPKDDSPNSGVDWLGALSGISGLAPIMSNLFTSDPEKVLANYNPYTRAISNTMSRRRFNIEPAIQDIRRNRSVTDYNASQMNTNTGANMAYRLQSAIAQNDAIAAIRAQENNVNNQDRGEYANMMNNLGQQFVAANNLADDLNAQNRATARNIRRAGLSQLSGWFQNRELMRNQRNRDRAMLTMYGPLLQSVLTENDYNTLMRYYNK